MGRVRISVSLDENEAERIRSHADSAGMDVSAYVVNAAVRQMAETEAAEAGFAKVDALIAESEARAERWAPVEKEPAEPLTEDERRDVEEAMRLVYGPGDDEGRNRGVA